MRNLVSEQCKALPYSGIREIFDLAGSMKDVVHLEVGEPDFDTPTPIIEAAFEAAKAGETHYTPSAGIGELREMLAARLTQQIGVPYDASEIVVTTGAMEAILLAMLVTLDRENEVLVPSPHWPNYPAHILLAGGLCRTLRLEQEDGFSPTPTTMEREIGSRTRALLINYPHNPTGAVLDKDCMDEIADLARDKDLLVYSDDAYESLIYEGGRFCSIASLEGMKGRTIVIRTFSKSYAMTGWRVGYLAAPREIAEKAAKLHEHTTACTSTISQMAALAALRLPEEVTQKMVKEYERRRDVLLSELDQVPGLAAFKPQGTFYAFVDIRPLGVPSFEFSRVLLKEARVAVAPGSAFGADGEGYVRICFANSIENLKEGASRMREFLQRMA